MPYCLDPFTLETLGPDSLNGNLTLGCLGAHFKIDALEKVAISLFSMPIKCALSVSEILSIELCWF